jgi:hypothetical protein
MARKPLSPHERRLASLFFESVMAKTPSCCARLVCEGGQADEAHHVIPKQRLRNQFCEVEVVWDSRIGLPVCNPCHQLLTTAARRLTPDKLRPENIEFAFAFSLDHELAREVVGYDPE